MPDMTVTVNGTTQLAERACRMIFGENADLGPVRPAPAVLLAVKDDWPGRADEPLRIALDMPLRFDIERDMGRHEAKAVVLTVNRITVLCQGRKVGYAIRTDQAGLNALDLYDATWRAFRQRMAH